MKNRKVKGNYQIFSDQDFLSLAQTVRKAMSGNPNFKESTSLLEALNTSIEEFHLNLAASSKRGSPEDTAIKNFSRKNLEIAISDLAHYVNKVGNGKLRVLLSSGLIVSRTIKAYPIPAKVEGIKLKDGRQKEQIVLNFEPQYNIRIYKYRYTKDKDASGNILWTGEEFTTTSSRNNLIAPVTQAATYYVSVQAANATGMGDWSDPVSWIAR